MKLVLIICLILAAQPVWASIDTGISAAISPDRFYDPARRLIIEAAGTKWDFFGGDDLTSRTVSADIKLQFVARSPAVGENNVQSTLTMRVDPGDWKTARSYAERWLRDYPKFGYELQMARDNQYGNLKGYDIEISSNTSHRRARQFIVKHDREMWVFTCSADTKHFSEAWTSCEKILKTASAQ
jgi:hypothetical protein